MATKVDNKGVTTFIYDGNSTAKKVFLTGDFNCWDAAARRMIKARDGSFRARLELAPGIYEYKFIVDGEWIADSTAENHKKDPFGGLNSVVKIG